MVNILDASLKILELQTKVVLLFDNAGSMIGIVLYSCNMLNTPILPNTHAIL
jgi:hypothetical protein